MKESGYVAWVDMWFDSRQRGLHSQTYAYLQRLSHRGLPPPHTRANVYTQHLHTQKTWLTIARMNVDSCGGYAYM